MKQHLFLLGTLFCGGFVLQGDILSTFDLDLEGWTKDGDLSSVYEWRADAGRDGGGGLYWSDAAISKGDNIFAPIKFRGDLSGYETFTFDLKRGNDAVQSPLEVTFSSSAGSVVVDLGTTYSSTWATYSIDLATEVFPFVDETAVTGIKVKIDLVSGGDVSYVDNVGLLAAVPEPSALGLMLGGIVVVSTLRRRR